METLHKQIEKILAKTLGEWLPLNEIKKILLIDDNKDAVILGALFKEGYEVIHCDSVRKAWGFVYPHPPHLIIVHLNDPNRAGLAVFHGCWALAKRVPIILATSAHPALTKALEHRSVGILFLPSTRKLKRETLNDPQVSAMRR
jgi:DNA-binding NtrC family response regulator